ncbi:DUF916 domain-containing protein [Bacillus thuringiensis]|uniref:DUF916 domain-containing protein n=1 Tax=Bacillus thuringiensis TaxID=1428 RepID=UPI000CD87F31|nr:DUF916 domain-containing protein [Bacillus thuringiensis]
MILKKTNRRFLTFLLILMTLIVNEKIAYAQTSTSGSDGIGFAASPVLEEHQSKKDINYWWLNVAPSEQITLYVQVNNGDKENTFDITSNQAVTNHNFVVDYGQKKENARKLLVEKPVMDFYKDVLLGDKKEVGKTTITLKPKQSAKVPITVIVPKQGINGTVIGGINVTRKPSESEQKNNFVNVYNYSFALIMESGERPKEQVLGLLAGSMKVEEQKINLVNHKQALINRVKVYATVKDSKGKVYSSFESPTGVIVPKANIELALVSKEALKNNQTYDLEINAKLLDKDGDINRADYKLMVGNDGEIQVAKAEDKGNRTSLWLYLGFFIFVLIVFITGIYAKKRIN